MPNNPLDRNSFAPLYFQLIEKIKVMIEQQFAPGDLIPSEVELMARYDVSRNTVREAINKLVEQGFVMRVQGKGTFVVSKPNRYGLQKLVSFSEDMNRRGLHADTRLLGLVQEEPLSNVAFALGLNPGDQVYKIQRLRLADGEPMAISTTYLPCMIIPGLTEAMIARGSLYELLASRNVVRIGYADRILKPVAADLLQSELLQIPEGSPLIRLEGTTFLENDQPVEYVVAYYRGDRYEFTYHAVR